MMRFKVLSVPIILANIILPLTPKTTFETYRSTSMLIAEDEPALKKEPRKQKSAIKIDIHIK